MSSDWVLTTLICSPRPWWPVSESWEAKYAAAACSLHLNCRDGADVTASAAALRHRARTGNPSSASEVQLILSEKKVFLMLQCPWEGTKVHTTVPCGKKETSSQRKCCGDVSFPQLPKSRLGLCAIVRSSLFISWFHRLSYFTDV